MLEGPYMPDRKGFNRAYDVRDWLTGEVRRTYHKRSAGRYVALAFVFVAIVIFMALIGAAGKADATPMRNKAVMAGLTCAAMDQNGVTDKSMLRIATALQDNTDTKTEARQVFAYAVEELCPVHKPAVLLWLHTKTGTYSHDWDFTNGIPPGSVPGFRRTTYRSQPIALVAGTSVPAPHRAGTLFHSQS